MHVLEEGAAMTTTIRDEAVSADAAPVSLPVKDNRMWSAAR